ncbi:MAG: SH3 domain-containing protein [Bacteroidota bacterium]
MLTNCNKGESTEGSMDHFVNSIENQLDQDSIRSIYRSAIAKQLDKYPQQPTYERGKLYPVDEAPQDTNFFVFRTLLNQAVEKREIFQLIEHLSANVFIDSTNSGIEAFTQRWNLSDQNNAIQSDLWDKLAVVLGQGGSFNGGNTTFLMPYYHQAALINGNQSGDKKALIYGSGVRIRLKPDLNSEVVDKLSHEVVQLDEITDISTTISNETYTWYKITTRNNKTGFVWGKFLRPIEAAKLEFRKENAGWKISKLVL